MTTDRARAYKTMAKMLEMTVGDDVGKEEGADMTVYVDNMRASFGRMVMCHMAADTLDELLAMADRIGVARKWLQQPPKASWVHFDIALSKRALAVQYGAVECTAREMAAYAWHRDRQGKAIPPAEAWPLYQDALRERMVAKQ